MSKKAACTTTFFLLVVTSWAKQLMACVCVCCAHYFLGLFNLLFISTNLFFRLGTHCTSIFKYRQQSLHINTYLSIGNHCTSIFLYILSRWNCTTQIYGKLFLTTWQFLTQFLQTAIKLCYKICLGSLWKLQMDSLVLSNISSIAWRWNNVLLFLFTAISVRGLSVS